MSLPTVAPIRWQVWETKRSLQKPCGIESKPRVMKEVHKLISIHNHLGAEAGLGSQERHGIQTLQCSQTKGHRGQALGSQDK